MKPCPGAMQQTLYVSPYGTIRLCAQDGRLLRVVLGGRAGREAEQQSSQMSGALAPFVRLLERYFHGEEIPCDASLLSVAGLTDFQCLVLELLAQVRFARVVSYGELARLCGRPGAARAVGRVLGVNPLPIFLPCHRVVAAGGRLGGFGAGLHWKRALLEHEGWCVANGRLLRAAKSGRSRPRGGGLL